MQRYDFTYTFTATGVQSGFTIPDPAEDAYAATVARAVFNALNRVTDLSDVTATKITDVHTVTRGNVT